MTAPTAHDEATVWSDYARCLRDEEIDCSECAAGPKSIGCNRKVADYVDATLATIARLTAPIAYEALREAVDALDEVEAMVATANNEYDKAIASCEGDTDSSPSVFVEALFGLDTQLLTTMRELATEREARGRMEAVVEWLLSSEADDVRYEIVMEWGRITYGHGDWFADAIERESVFHEWLDPQMRECAALAALDAQRIAGAE